MFLKDHLKDTYQKASLEKNNLILESVINRWVHRFGLETMNLELVALHAPYGDLTCKSCISILFSLTVFSLIIIGPLLNRKLN